MSEVPEGWAETRLGDLGNYINGRAFKPTEWRDNGLPIIRIQNLNDPKARFNYSDKRHEEKYRVKSGDLLVAWSASLGAFVWERGEAWLNQHIFRVEPRYEIVTKEFLHYAVKEAIAALYTKTHGSGMVHITKPVFESHQIPLPPLNEQKRIVEKVEKLLGKVEAAQSRLDKIPAILKRFRQSVLAAACSGKLTADWRGVNEMDGDTGFPKEWNIVVLGSLFPKGGLFDGPFGSNLKSSDYSESGVRVVRLENVGHLNFIGEKETYITPAKFQSLKKHEVGEGDIIFASFIANEIRACILPALTTKAIAKADCFCLRPNDNVDRKYLVLQLVNRRTYDDLVSFVHGATRPRINTTQLKTLTVPLCSLDEQREIVRRVEGLFKFADQIEERYKKARSYTNKLTQSILAKAFRGELVPQDPNDEPASELLLRLNREVPSSSKARSK